MRILIGKTKSITVAFVCLWVQVVRQVAASSLARVSYRMTSVPNDARALLLACDYDTHTWVQNEREMKVTVKRVVFVRFVCSIVNKVLQELKKII